MRELNYTVGIDRVDPSGILFGGQQGEHNATKINVALTEDLVSALADCNNYRFEAEDGAGARRIINKDAYSNEESLSCLIPQYVTSSGGTVTVHLVFVQTDNGEAEKICWSVAMRMRFERNISDNGYSDDEGIHDVQLLVEECKTSATAAQNAQSEAETARDTSIEYSNTAADSADKAKSYAEKAGNYSTAVNNAKTAAEKARDDAKSAESNAKTSENNASTYESNALDYKEAAEAAKESVENLLNDAETGLASKVDKSQIVSEISYPTDIPNGGAVLALGEDLIRSKSVSSIEKQSLSDAQKEQARSNIGALSSSDLEKALSGYVDADELEGALSPLNQYRVSVLDPQEFSEAQKALGRSNIGAAKDAGTWRLLKKYNTVGATMFGDEGNITYLDLNGKTFSLKACAVKMYNKAAAEKSVNLSVSFLNANAVQVAAHNISNALNLNTSATSGIAVCEPFFGFYKCWGTASIYHTETDSVYTLTKSVKDNPITGIRLNPGSGFVLGSGDYIEIWGVDYE